MWNNLLIDKKTSILSSFCSDYIFFSLQYMNIKTPTIIRPLKLIFHDEKFSLEHFSFLFRQLNYYRKLKRKLLPNLWIEALFVNFKFPLFFHSPILLRFSWKYSWNIPPPGPYSRTQTPRISDENCKQETLDG